MLKNLLLMRVLIGIFTLVFCFSMANAQIDSIAFDKNYKFSDGLYLSHASLTANTPEYDLSEVEMGVFTNPSSLITKVKMADETIQNQLWAIVINGLPFVRIPEQNEKLELTSFAALKIRGRLSYFSFLEEEQRAIPITAYNPANGRPFRRATVTREETILKEFILDFADGSTLLFNFLNLKELISGDSKLVAALNELGKEAEPEALYKTIKIYDDRHPFLLPSKAQKKLDNN